MRKQRFFTTAAHPNFIIPDQFYWLEYNTYLQKKTWIWYLVFFVFVFFLVFALGCVVCGILHPKILRLMSFVAALQIHSWHTLRFWWGCSWKYNFFLFLVALAVIKDFVFYFRTFCFVLRISVDSDKTLIKTHQF